MSVEIIDELRQNFIDFSYEANSQRAFADARDGLKPGQRACLWEMYVKGYASNKPHVKSAKVSGGTIATWWPHGDASMYDTFVRMSQNWINNIPEVDFHGNNGNIVIGNVPASSRYTEVRLSKATEEGMFCGINKNTVPMIMNFSEDEEWPEVFPAIFPRLLVNGCQGIGVTIANFFAPMNLNEVSEAIINYAKGEAIDFDSKYYFDFPTGGIIINKDELRTIHETGTGRIIVRAKTEIKDNLIIINELPYQVFVEPWIESVKKLIADGTITGIDDIYNKTDKTKMMIEVNCSGTPEIVLNQLFALTELEKTYNPNQYALVGKTPKLLTFKDCIEIYLAHNKECIKKEYEYDLNNAKKRIEIVNGSLIALDNIDDIIKILRNASSSAEAIEELVKKYGLTETQASKSIVNMRLSSLTKMDSKALKDEKNALEQKIIDITNILSKEEKITDIVIGRLEDFVKKYSTPRKTEVIQDKKTVIKTDVDEVAFVEPEKCVVIMTEAGTIKRIPASMFKPQKKGGIGTKTQEEITSAVIRTNTVDRLMIFTDKGNMYRLLVNDIPSGTNVSKGTPIKSLTAMEVDEKPSVIYSIYRDTDAQYVLFVTKKGLVKKTKLDEYTSIRKKAGIAAIKLRPDDELADVTLVKNESIIITTNDGMAIKFDTEDITASGRLTSGVKGIGLRGNDFVVSATPIRNKEDDLAIFTSTGYAKRVKQKDINPQHRGGVGVRVFKTDVAKGSVATTQLLVDEDFVLIIGNKSSICISAKDIPVSSRIATGNIVFRGGKLVDASKV